MGKTKRPRKSSWNSVHGGVEICYGDVHLVLSPLPTREATLDEILRIEASGSGWRLPTEKEALVIRRFIRPVNQLMLENGGATLSSHATIWLHGNYGTAEKLGDVQGRIFSMRFAICCWNSWRISRDFRLVKVLD
jgi:hypothetical protein